MAYLTLLAAVLFASCTCSGSRGGEGDAHWSEASLQDYPDAPIPWDGPICGNNIVESPEECDDGGRRDCDGCDRNCRLEIEGCGREDGAADAGDGAGDGDVAESPGPPGTPEPAGDVVPVETPEGESTLVDRYLNLRVIWTGRSFAVMYRLWCPSGDSHCLGMTRFDREGVVLSPVWIYEPVEREITDFDFCWNGNGFGVVWADNPSAYVLLLNSDGKPIKGPVRICDGCLAFLEGPGFVGSPRIGCGEEAYLVGYNVTVEPWVTWRWLQGLSGQLDLLDGGFIGQSSLNAVTRIFSHAGAWRIVHSTKTIDTFPEAAHTFALDALTTGLDYEWRSLLSWSNPHYVDYDVLGDEAAIAYSGSGEDYTLARLDLDDGAMRHQFPLSKTAVQIASIGEGRIAALGLVVSCHGEGSDCCMLSVLDETGLESGGVEISCGSPGRCGDFPYDLVWTGSELGVVTAFEATGGGCRFFLQRFVP